MSTPRIYNQTLSIRTVPFYYTGIHPSHNADSSQKLPDEIFYLIARDFAELRVISRLSQMCRQLAGLLKGLIYRRNVLDVKAAQEAATAKNRHSSHDRDQIFESIKELQMHVRRPRISCSQFSALHWAARRGAVEIVRTTIRTSSRLFPEYVNVKDWRDLTPLAYAAAGGHVEIMQELIDAGCLVNAGIRFEFVVGHSPEETFNDYVLTPLIFAIFAQQEAAATILARLTFYQDVLYTRPGLASVFPLPLAALARMPRVVEILLSHGYNPWETRHSLAGLSAVHQAVSEEDNTETIDILLGHDVSMNYTGLWRNNTPLETAIRHQCFRNALHLIKHYLPSGEYGRWAEEALNMTAGYDDGFAVTEALAELVNAEGEFYVIEDAFLISSKDMSKSSRTNKFLGQLLATGLDRNHLGGGGGYLHWACQQDPVNVKVIKLMLENEDYPLDINEKDDDTYTPLDHLVEWGYDDIATLFRERYFAKAGDEF